jgi:16S rRNA pseudouridine516 synthase
MDVIMIRLDKFLADMSVGTRAEVKKFIRQGSVEVDGVIVRTPEIKIDEKAQTVTCKGNIVSYETFEYYMLNKPAGVVSATTDSKNRTVIDLIDSKKRKDLFPVGRLDKDTEGLLLITNDGELAHKLLSPKKHVDKVYYAKVDGVVTLEDIKIFNQGVAIGENEVTMPAKLEIILSDVVSEICLTIQEGKFHQVKRMFEAVGKKVLYLKRLSMGPLQLDASLAPGEYRLLTKEELNKLC